MNGGLEDGMMKGGLEAGKMEGGLEDGKLVTRIWEIKEKPVPQHPN